jgi:hypothetical protein
MGRRKGARYFIPGTFSPKISAVERKLNKDKSEAVMWYFSINVEDFFYRAS